MAIVPAGAGDSEFCAGNNGQTISKCPKTCTAACADSGFVSRSIVIRDACRGVMGVAREKLVDSAECEELASSANDSCSAFATPSADDAIPTEGEQPPDCLHSFTYLQCRFERLATTISDLNARFAPMVTRYRPLREQVREGQDPDEIEKFLCSVTLKDMSADYRTSEALADDVKELTKEFDTQTKCVVKTQNWIGTLKFTSHVEQSAIKQAIIAGLNRRLERPRKAQEKVQGLISDVQESRSVISDTYLLHRAVCAPVRR